MADPIAKARKIVEVGETKFAFATTIKNEPLLKHDVRIEVPHGNSVDVPMRDIIQFVAEAFVLPLRKRTLDKQIEDEDFTSVLLGRI